MSLRLAIVCLLSLLGACADSSDSDLTSAERDSGGISAQSLQFVERAESGVLPNASAELAVRYADLLGGTVSGVAIDFALTGSSAGASLTPARAITDADGIARTTLRVGSTRGDLQVRARTSNGATVYTLVSVGEALGSQLAVSVVYLGKRQVSSYTVTALPGMTCEAALKSGLAGDVSYTFPASSTPVSFKVGSGLSAAIVGFGRDESNAKLAQGCTEFKAAITADAAAATPALVLSLDNQPLSLDNALQVELHVALQGAAERISDAAISGSKQALAGKSEGDYLLDAVAQALSQQGNSAAVASLVERRSPGTLAGSLGNALTQGNAGPLALGTQLGALLQDRGGELTLSGRYSAGTLGQVSSLGALSSDGLQSLTLTPRPAVNLVSSFSSELAQVSVSSLRIDLPLGDYAVAVLTAIRAESSAPATKPSVIDAAAGCASVLGPWWKGNDLTAVCDASVAVAACQAAQTTLLTQIQSTLQGLNANANASGIQLSGTVQAEDRTDDGQIDDLGSTAVSGKWGVDAVSLDLSVPVRTAFAAAAL